MKQLPRGAAVPLLAIATLLMALGYAATLGFAGWGLWYGLTLLLDGELVMAFLAGIVNVVVAGIVVTLLNIPAAALFAVGGKLWATNE